MSDAGQQNYAYAQNVAQQPLQQYQGQMVADVSPQMQQAWNVAANSGNVGSDQFNAATAGYLGALGQSPTTKRHKRRRRANTYLAVHGSRTPIVINATLPLMQQQNALSQNQQANAANPPTPSAARGRAFSKASRRRRARSTSARWRRQLNQANYNQARQASESTSGRINRTSSTLERRTPRTRQPQQEKINSDILASQGLTNTGDEMNKSNVANYNMLQCAGAAQEMQQQNQINAQMAKFNQAFNYPQQQLGVLESFARHDPARHLDLGPVEHHDDDADRLGLDPIQQRASAAGSIYVMMSDKSMKTDIDQARQGPEERPRCTPSATRGRSEVVSEGRRPDGAGRQRRFPGVGQEASAS